MAAWAKMGEGTAKASYESSSILARQIEQGAPADLYISANEKWMDYLAERKLIDPATRVDLLGNTLVLIGPKGVAPVDIAPGRSEEHTSELQSLMRISYAVFCLKKKK